MKSNRLWWLVFAACTALVLSSLAWMTATMLRSEHAELQAREMAQHQESLRLALWRMDSWIAPRIAREAARPYTDYQTLAPQQSAYNRLLEPIEAGAVLTASPLLPFQSPHFRLHFQVDSAGNFTSPQAPSDVEVALLNAPLPEAQLKAKAGELEKLSSNVSVDELIGCVMQVEQSLDQGDASENDPTAASAGRVHDADATGAGANAASSGLGQLDGPVGDGVPPLLAPTPSAQTSTRAAAPGPAPQQVAGPIQKSAMEQTLKNEAEWTKRQQAFIDTIHDAAQTGNMSQIRPGGDEPAVDIGPLVPIWFGGDERASGELMFVRRVRVNGTEYYQGFVCDWPSVRDSLLGEIDDLFPEAVLIPDRRVNMRSASASSARLDRAATSLATLPVSLEVPAPDAAAASGLTPGRVTAGIAWIVVLAGVGLTASTLRSSIAFGRKRAQFASAVTHELRTPLTTFKMYTDMLAEDMVRDETQKREYLRTLQEESDRLARLVENVLSYARLEDGRQTSSHRAMTVRDLLDRVTPQLERRAAAAGMRYETVCSVADGASIHVDDDAIGQILLNLIDNACKYGRNGDDSLVQLLVESSDDWLTLTVCDHGPGIPAHEAKYLFRAFRRGSTSDDSQPGLGIGLTLSHALARRMGGVLEYVPGEDGGARFRLAVPLLSHQA